MNIGEPPTSLPCCSECGSQFSIFMRDRGPTSPAAPVFFCPVCQPRFGQPNDGDPR